MPKRKKVREAIGYTASKQNSNPAVWLWLALGYRNAAEVLHEQRERIPNNSRPFAFNAAYSLELLLKCLLAQAGLAIPSGSPGHNLPDLSAKANIKLNPDQIATLEDFSEIIVWLGRYPAPTKEGRWDNYQDIILEKHVVRGTTNIAGKTASFTRANPATFTNWENYIRIWDVCFAKVDAKLKA